MMMTQAAEKIWAQHDTSGVCDEWQMGWYMGRPNPRHTVEYVRADIHRPRIEALEAENARLREAVAYAMTELGQSAQDAHAIRAEAALERAFRTALSTDPVGE
jgi:hypothetical protein